VPRAERLALRFVRALLPDGRAHRQGESYVAAGVAMPADQVRVLITDGVLRDVGTSCTPTAEASSWLKRSMLDEDAFAAQHRVEARGPAGLTLNLAESPLARLAAGGPDGAAFLAPHQVEAGERVRRLAERAQLQPRITMSYSATHTAGGGQANRATEIGDMAFDARKHLAELYRVLPRDCADVILDVCGLLKGLQLVESERGWPRRSAKLVLRVGLEQLAQHYGLAHEAVGVESRRRSHAWLGDGARPTRFE
jgi:hypothetical protein